MSQFLRTPNNSMPSDNDEQTPPDQLSPPKQRRRRRREMRQLALSSAAAAAGGGGERRVFRPDPVPEVGTMSVSGRSRAMEDAIRVVMELCEPVICRNKPVHFFGVYDGHGGSYVAALCRERMHAFLEEELSRVPITAEVPNNIGSSSRGSSSSSSEVPRMPEAEVEWWWRMVVASCFRRMDDLATITCGGCGSLGVMCGCHPMESTLTGSTAVVAVVTPDHIIVANCGDSRAVLSRGGMTVPLSFDQKPDRPDERARIEACGGRVIFLNGYRVDGVLAMSRAIGDKFLKPSIISEPEITFTRRHPNDEFLILASDGLWDVIPSDLACSVARQCLLEDTQPTVDPRAGVEREAVGAQQVLHQTRSASAAALLTRLALGRKSTDNISVIVVDLKRSS